MRFATCDLCGKAAMVNIYYAGKPEAKYEAACADCAEAHDMDDRLLCAAKSAPRYLEGE